MSDIMERLRGLADLFEAGDAPRHVVLHMRAGADEIERLRAALEDVMIGGNSLAQIIGADHPPHGTPYSEVLAHYGGGVKYEAWCCWNTIMQARAALAKQSTTEEERA